VDTVLNLEFTFLGKTYNAVLMEDRHIYVPLVDICAAMEIDTEGATERIEREPAMYDALKTIKVDRPYQSTTRKQNTAHIMSEWIPAFMASVSTNEYGPEKKDTIIQYKREFAAATFALYRSDMIPEEYRAELDQYLPPQAKLANDAGELLLKAARIESIEGDVDQLGNAMAAVLGDMEVMKQNITGILNRMREMEGRKLMYPPQLKAIKDMIGQLTVAIQIREKNKMDYATASKEAYRKLYGKFRINKYDQLRADQFDAVREFLLSEWSAIMVGRSIPTVFTVSQQSLFEDDSI